ncbi:hypothetical protein IWQ62_000888 [Dispira parvispora]|uniref:SDR family oxidoreductase n=1 Tax=Dispira parvispora TaxID=1520584 RepID=A0A9W8E4I2_9FUNG|nr:hypothetical protein IWQ62_000888 [Dispira parvispora]
MSEQPSRFDVHGKVAVITGAASGFGELLAQRLVAKGCRVVLGDIAETPLQNVVHTLNERYPQSALGQRCDVRNFQDIQQLFDIGLAKFKQVDILVNNAGIAELQSFFQDHQTAWTDVVDINFKAVLYGTQYAVQHWLQVGQTQGVVVNCSSASAFSLLPISPIYAATKAAVLHFTSNCKPLRKQGIRVNAIAPFFSETALVTNNRQRNSQFAKVLQGLPLVPKELVVDAYLECIENQSLAGKTLSILPSSGIQEFKPLRPKL